MQDRNAHKVKFDELRSREGYDPQKEAANFGPVWRGGEWGLRNITKYMTTGAFLLLKHAAENREEWLRRFYEIGKEAVRSRKRGELFGFLLKPNPRVDVVRKTLEEAGVETVLPKVGTYFYGTAKKYPEGTRLIRMDQPYSNFAKAILEVQRYPDLRDVTGHPISPYDVTAHTLTLLTDVAVEPVKAPFKYIGETKAVTEVVGGRAAISWPPAIDLVALYKSAVPSIDEGWTRWIFDSNSYPYASISDRQIRDGDLAHTIGASLTKQPYRAIILPDQPSRTILNGYARGAMPPDYTGGLGADGVRALREFIEQGGTLICLNRASDFAIDQFKLPLKDVVAGLPRTDFYVPGSILRIELDTSNPLAAGMPKETIAWAEDSPAFEVTAQKDGSSVAPAAVHVVAEYPKNRNPLLSGWLLGASRIKGKAALVEVTMGKGKIILFGFRPQYRGQSLATYPLFFNAISKR